MFQLLQAFPPRPVKAISSHSSCFQTHPAILQLCPDIFQQFLNLDFVTKYQTHVIKLTEAGDHTEGSLVTSRVVLPPSPSHPQGRPVSPVGHVQPAGEVVPAPGGEVVLELARLISWDSQLVAAGK